MPPSCWQHSVHLWSPRKGGVVLRGGQKGVSPAGGDARHRPTLLAGQPNGRCCFRGREKLSQREISHIDPREHRQLITQIYVPIVHCLTAVSSEANQSGGNGATLKKSSTTDRAPREPRRHPEREPGTTIGRTAPPATSSNVRCVRRPFPVRVPFVFAFDVQISMLRQGSTYDRDKPMNTCEDDATETNLRFGLSKAEIGTNSQQRAQIYGLEALNLRMWLIGRRWDIYFAT